MHVADDLSPAARTVYRLACQIRDADRSRDQKTEVGDALQQLIAGADCETMAERIAGAVDIRAWVGIASRIELAAGEVPAEQRAGDPLARTSHRPVLSSPASGGWLSPRRSRSW